MTWILSGISLPIPPKKISKKTSRENKIVATIEDFPNPNLNQPTRFELELEGLIWPRSLAQSLDEATKNPEDESFTVALTGTDAESKPWIQGYYTVTRSEVGMDGPKYINTNDEVFDYKLTLTKFADEGSVEPGEEVESDENGSAFDDLIPNFGFDKNGDGDIDGDELFNWLANILTFGVVK